MVTNYSHHHHHHNVKCSAKASCYCNHLPSHTPAVGTSPHLRWLLTISRLGADAGDQICRKIM